MVAQDAGVGGLVHEDQDSAVCSEGTSPSDRVGDRLVHDEHDDRRDAGPDGACQDAGIVSESDPSGKRKRNDEERDAVVRVGTEESVRPRRVGRPPIHRLEPGPVHAALLEGPVSTERRTEWERLEQP